MVYLVKSAGHAEERRKQRIPDVNVDTLSRITQQVKSLGLDSGVYHVPVRKAGELQGYAVYRRRGPRSVGLVTVYSKDMKPPGPNLEMSIKKAGMGDGTNAFEMQPYTTYDEPKPSQSDIAAIPGSDRSTQGMINFMWDATIDDGRNAAFMNANQESSIGPGYIKESARRAARDRYGV